MSPAHVLEPTYRTLKQHLIEGIWPPGQRLETGRLAEDLFVSATPVRDCLNRLVGERLIDFRPGEGYRVARITEGQLRDLIAFNAALLDLALRAATAGPREAEAKLDSADYAASLAGLCNAIAARSDNAALCESVRALNDRLHAARRCEIRLFPDADAEVATLARQFRDGSRSLRQGLTRYHSERRKAAGRIIALLETAR
jgi:DNA-binding GntR family transcriptional regulator